jgi:hypothetical protein
MRIVVETKVFVSAILKLNFLSALRVEEPAPRNPRDT